MTTWDATVGGFVVQIPVSIASTGDNIIITGMLGKEIKVLQWWLVYSIATTVSFKSGTTVISGPMTFPAAAAHDQDYLQLPLTCNPGDNFIINTSNAVPVGGTLWYAQV